MFKRGDVLMARLPRAGGSVQTGTKACVVVSNDIGNKFGPTLVVVALTSRVLDKAKLPTHILLEKSEFGFLKCDSLALCEQPLTIPKSCVIDKMGFIEPSKMDNINKGLKIELSLN